MQNTQQVTQYVGDKELLQDSLLIEKSMTEGYNTFAGECVSEQLRGTFLNILDDEHRIQADVFNNLQSRGWYQVEPAEQKKIQNVRQKYSCQP